MTEISDPPRKDTKFQKGVVPKVRRKRGVLNKVTRDLRHGIIEGAVKHGEDGKGKGGHLRWAAHKQPKAYLALLGRLLPYNVAASANATIAIGDINIVQVPEDRFIRRSEAARQMVIEPEPPVELPAPEPVTIEQEPEPEPAPETSAELINFRRRKE
jgi:hypothetical protein